MSDIRSAIYGVGQYYPSKVVTNDDLAKLFQTSDEWIWTRSGIRERRYVEGNGIGASDLAVPAVKQACERAKIQVEDIDAIIFGTLSPDYTFPGSGVFLQTKLGLKNIPCLDVRNQCSGFLYGLSIADAWVRCGMYKRVAVVGAEVHSTGIEFSDRGREVTVLFGDGAGCAIVGPSTEHPLGPTTPDGKPRGLIGVDIYADGVGAQDLWIESPKSNHMPRLTHEMIDDGTMWPKMKGKQVFRWATEKMPEAVFACLKKHELTIRDVDLFVPHQANMRINQFVGSRLELEPEKIVHNIEKFGNTTAATIPMAMCAAIDDGRLKDGTLLLWAAFGAGYTWGAGLCRF